MVLEWAVRMRNVIRCKKYMQGIQIMCTESHSSSKSIPPLQSSEFIYLTNIRDSKLAYDIHSPAAGACSKTAKNKMLLSDATRKGLI